jgi:hypothetical protein
VRPAAHSALERQASPTNPIEPGTQASTARELPKRGVDALYSNDSYGDCEKQGGDAAHSWSSRGGDGSRA